ncbi:MAG: hypothetical protein ABL931_02565 [Usitatibacteraceae bacterium]
MSNFVRRSLASALLFASATAFASLTTSDKQAVIVSTRQNTGAEFLTTVDLGKQRYRFVTLVPDFETDPNVRKSQSMSGWKGDYLFVRQQCASLGVWRCTVDQVFTRDGGKLVHLGDIESSACKTPGCNYDVTSKTFTDLYDGLATNPVSGQVDTPPLKIARRVVNGRLVSDLDLSWALNKDVYSASIACLEKVAKSGFVEPCSDNQEPWSALVFAAKLTHYAGRTAERASLFATLAVAYCEKSADPNCNKRVAGAKEHFSRFPQGDAPKFVPFPITLTSVDAPETKVLAPQEFRPGKALKLNL